MALQSITTPKKGGKLMALKGPDLSHHPLRLAEGLRGKFFYFS